MKTACRFLIQVLFRFRAYDLAVLKTPGPVLLIPNHRSWIDWLFLWTCLDEDWKFVTSSISAQTSWLHRKLMINHYTLPVDPGSPYAVKRGDAQVTVRIRGGLLGHWSVWTRSAVEQLRRIHAAVESGSVPASLLALDSRVTDCNSAFFDVGNGFAGCIPGCHEVLRRQGLLEGTWCLDPNETLSTGQDEEITRVCREHADLADDAFVAANLQRWLA